MLLRLRLCVIARADPVGHMLPEGASNQRALVLAPLGLSRGSAREMALVLVPLGLSRGSAGQMALSMCT